MSNTLFQISEQNRKRCYVIMQFTYILPTMVISFENRVCMCVCVILYKCACVSMNVCVFCVHTSNQSKLCLCMCACMCILRLPSDWFERGGLRINNK